MHRLAHWIIAGFVVGILVASLGVVTLLTPWEQLPPVPGGAVEVLGEFSGGLFVRGVDYAVYTCDGFSHRCVVGGIIGTYDGGSYVRAGDGAVYGCASYGRRCWEEELYAPALPGGIDQPPASCGVGLRGAWRVQHWFAPLAQCVVTDRRQADGMTRVALLLDQAGVVWRFVSSTLTASQSVEWCIVAMFGWLATLLLGAAVAVIRWLGSKVQSSGAAAVKG